MPSVTRPVPQAAGLLLCSCTIATPTLQLPTRPADAPGGVQLRRQLDGLTLEQREKRVLREWRTGNVPTQLRRLVPVHTRARIDGRAHRATFWCTPDYLGLGHDADWFRMPLSPPAAQAIADRHDCLLPTRRMVDAFWQPAAQKLRPAPFSPKRFDITSVEVFFASHQKIEAQGDGARSSLVAGIKKDVVASQLIASNGLDWHIGARRVLPSTESTCPGRTEPTARPRPDPGGTPC